MTQLLALLASTSAWKHTITPESSILPYCSFSTPVALHRYLFFIYQILTCIHWLQHCLEGLSVDTAQMDTWKGSYTYDIASLTGNLAAPSRFNRQWWLYVYPAGRYTAFSDSYFSQIENTISMIAHNSAVTHRGLCHVVSANSRCFTHNYYVWRTLMQGHTVTFMFSKPHLASTTG